jgi:DNA-binding MarR family transcriptional regulator
MNEEVFQSTDGMNVLFVHSSLDDMGLTPFAFRTYCHLARRANKSNKAWPGMTSMSNICGFSDSTAKRSIKELEERGMLVVERSNGGLSTNKYHLTPASDWTPPGSHRTRFPQNPVPTEPTPGSHRPTKVIQEGDPLENTSPGLESDPSSKPFLPKTIAETWNTTCPSLPKVVEITAKRFKSINARCNGSIEELERVCQIIEASDFLTGRLVGTVPNWMNFDWITNATNYAKVCEGRYTNKDKVDRSTSQDNRF